MSENTARPGLWDAFTDSKAEISAAVESVRDAHWQVARVRRFVSSGRIDGGSAVAVTLSEIEMRLTDIANELETELIG